MKNIKKLLFLATIPVLALTGCNNSNEAKKSITYFEAVDHVANNYDANAFDNLESTYYLKMNKFNINLDVTAYSGGASSSFNICVGLDGVSIQTTAPVVCFNSTLLGYFQGLWTRISGISMKVVTDMGCQLNYTIENGALTASVDSTESNKLTNIIASGLAVLNAAYPFLSLVQNRQTNVDYLKLEAQDSLNRVLKDGPSGGFDPMEIIKIIGALGIGLDQDNSTGVGYFNCGLKTSKKGYITDLYYRTGAELDLLMTSGKFIHETGEEESVIVLPEYNFHVKGSINIDYELCNDLNNN